MGNGLYEINWHHRRSRRVWDLVGLSSMGASHLYFTFSLLCTLPLKSHICDRFGSFYPFYRRSCSKLRCRSWERRFPRNRWQSTCLGIKAKVHRSRIHNLRSKDWQRDKEKVFIIGIRFLGCGASFLILFWVDGCLVVVFACEPNPERCFNSGLCSLSDLPTYWPRKPRLKKVPPQIWQTLRVVLQVGSL